MSCLFIQCNQKILSFAKEFLQNIKVSSAVLCCVVWCGVVWGEGVMVITHTILYTQPMQPGGQ